MVALRHDPERTPPPHGGTDNEGEINVSVVKPVIGVVEWVEKSIDPAVFLGSTVAQVNAGVVAYLLPMLSGLEYIGLEYIDDEWIAENPAPDLDDEAAVTAWLRELRDATTDAWLTIYEPNDYRDLR